MHRRAGDLISQRLTALGGTLPPAPHPRGVDLEQPTDAFERPAILTGLVDHLEQLALDLGVDPRRDGAAC